MRAEQALAYFKRRRDTMQLMEEDVDTDSYRVLKTPGRKSWAHNKYRLVTHWQPLPETPRKETY